MKTYFPLIEFTIGHNFFEDGKSDDIEIIIARNETKLKNNYHIFLKKIASWKFVLFIDHTDNFEELSRFLENEIRYDEHLIEFLVVAKNKKFFSYTNNIGSLGGGNFADWSLPFDSKVDVSLGFDINKKIKNSNDPLLKVFVSKKYPTTLACITLKITEKIGNTVYERVNNSNPLKATIQFESKSAFWQYILIPRTENETQLAVADMNQLVKFSEIEWAKLEDNQKAGFSYSDHEIRLSDKYPFKLQLWENHTNGQRILLNNLSFPDPTNPANFSQDEMMRNFISIYQYF